MTWNQIFSHRNSPRLSYHYPLPPGNSTHNKKPLHADTSAVGLHAMTHGWLNISKYLKELRYNSIPAIPALLSFNENVLITSESSTSICYKLWNMCWHQTYFQSLCLSILFYLDNAKFLTKGKNNIAFIWDHKRRNSAVRFKQNESWWHYC